ncbi:GlxA family transcriptional regulator [Microbulbifer halophilus]|uniref:GlxA family transcriptional regulator n=1 Tax=Microbulbifer halophilus TaxID=453963 RepID=A0ABW5E8N4_9GAMM|nr:GlxA family transcriptional regulator [Microbulbifer halophilus]MCW8125241.1 GlxA family transcriptional regulator [Microbulbifer halophilus]
MTEDSSGPNMQDTFQPPKFGNSDVVHIGFVLVPKFSFFALACCSEPLRVANRVAGRKLFQFTFISEDGRPVTASNEMPFAVDYSLGDCPHEYQTVVVVSGFDPLEGCGDALLSELKRLSVNGVSLGCVDTGAHILARAGLLQGQKAIVHWEASSGFQENYPSIQVVPERFMIEETRVSAAGGLSSLDMMLNIIGASHGNELAMAVAEQFTYNYVQSANDAQRMSPRSRLRTTNKRLIQAVQIMEQHLVPPLSVKQVAEKARISVREMERLFKKEVGTPPKRFYRHLRLENARQLLRQTDMTVLDIAIACGFQSSAYFSAAYRQDFGISPSRDRG